MHASLIIAAGGSGSRFQKGLAHQKGRPNSASKLFFSLAGKPLLVRVIENFQKIPGIRETVVAVPPAGVRTMQPLFRSFGLKGIKCVKGGKTRAASVRNALCKINPRAQWVMVHDGARPFVSKASLAKLFQAARHGVDGVILAKKVVPTLKETDRASTIRRTVDRSRLFEAETPQLVKKSLLLKAYRDNPRALEATDEASLLESVNARLKVVAHEAFNPKITHYGDLEMAEAYLQNVGARRAVPLRQIRTGIGRDTHRLVRGRKFFLGGVRIPFEKGALGHSDGDALLHAVSDAILGAIGAGDIGEWFSDRNPKFKNIRSGKILKKVLAIAEKKSWSVSHVDSVVILEKPKLGSLKKRIQKKMAKILALPEDAVSVKAKTAEGLGPEGEGLAVSSEAVVTMISGDR